MKEKLYSQRVGRRRRRRLSAPLPTYCGFKKVEYVDEIGRQYHFPSAIEVPEVGYGKKCVQLKIPIRLTLQTRRTPFLVQFPIPGTILKLTRIKRQRRVGGVKKRRIVEDNGYDTDIDEKTYFTIRVVSIIFARTATALLEYE